MEKDGKELRKRRAWLRERIKASARRGTLKGRDYIDEYLRLQDECVQSGYMKEVLDRPYLSKEYWDGIIDLKHQPMPRPKKTSAAKKAPSIKKTSEVLEGTQMPEKTYSPEGTQMPEKAYYRIVVAMDDCRDKKDLIIKFFDNLGMKPSNSQEDRIEYEFCGGEEGFKILKRSAMAMLDILAGGSFGVGIYGSKI